LITRKEAWREREREPAGRQAGSEREKGRAEEVEVGRERGRCQAEWTRKAGTFSVTPIERENEKYGLLASL
jgi:hypothetical protein